MLTATAKIKFILHYIFDRSVQLSTVFVFVNNLTPRFKGLELRSAGADGASKSRRGQKGA